MPGLSVAKQRFETALAMSAAVPTAHRKGMGKGAVPSVPEGQAKHPQSKQSHRGALYEGRRCAVAERHPDHEKADSVVSGIAEKVQGISLEGDGTRSKARGDGFAGRRAQVSV